MVRLSLRRAALAFSAAAGLVLTGSLSPSAAPATDPKALWFVVHNLCGSVHQLFGAPFPCLAVNRREGFAVVPNLQAKAEVLLVPTRRITGIEAPSLLTAAAPNYWRLAWEARHFLEDRAGRAIPRDDVGLAINSVAGRTQDQLHIHIACIRPKVRAMVAFYRHAVPGRRSHRKLVFGHDVYFVMPLAGAELAADPFKLVARDFAHDREPMGNRTIAVLGATLADGLPGFYLLAGHADPARHEAGHAEELLDKSCQD
jgi:CDP-diacylglycerol pyrophosphatase